MESIFDTEKIESRIQELNKAAFQKVLATLKANKVMVEARTDGIYTRLAGNGDSEAFTLDWANSYPLSKEDSEAIWTKALNDAYDVWELNKRETPFPLIAMNHIRSNYDLKAKNIQ